MIVALVGAFLTAAYTVRATYLTFFGEPRGAAAGGTDTRRTPRHSATPHDVQQEGELEPSRRRADATPAPSPSSTTRP